MFNHVAHNAPRAVHTAKFLRRVLSAARPVATMTTIWTMITTTPVITNKVKMGDKR